MNLANLPRYIEELDAEHDPRKAHDRLIDLLTISHITESEAIKGAKLFEDSVGEVGEDGMVNHFIDDQHSVKVHPLDYMISNLGAEVVNLISAGKIAYTLAALATQRAVTTSLFTGGNTTTIDNRHKAGMTKPSDSEPTVYFPGPNGSFVPSVHSVYPSRNIVDSQVPGGY